MRPTPRLLILLSILGLLAVMSGPDARALVRRLGDGRASERDAAARELIDLGSEAEMALMDAIRDDSPAVRRRARALLARLRDPGERESRLAEARAAVRAAGVRGGGLVAGDPLDERLLELGDAGSRALTDSAERIAEHRLVAGDEAESLGRHVTAESLASLARLLREDRVVASGVLRAAREAEKYGRRGLLTEPAEDDLVAVLADPARPGRRAAAALLLAAAHDDAIERATALVADAEPGVRIEAARALGRLGTAATEALGVLAGDEDAAVRVAALDALAAIPGRPRPEPALRNIAHQNAAVRAAAARLLVREALPQHMNILRTLESDRSVRVRSAVESHASR